MGRDRHAAGRARRRARQRLPRRDAGLPAPLQLQAGDRRPGRSAAGTGAAPPRRHDRTGAPAIAARLRDARRRARLPRDGATAETHAIRSVDDRVDQGQSDRHGILSSGGRSTGIVERDCAIAVARVTRAMSTRRDRRPRIARRGHGTPDRGRRDAGASARAARSRGRRPAGRQAHALAAADGARPRHARDRILHAQS